MLKVDIPDASDLQQQNLNIYEEMQSEEMSEDYELAIGVDNGRWITVDDVSAGEEHEKVLFRTFVDAAIGPRNRAVRSRDCPYLLILSSQDGDSEPKMTLCNQSGSLGVTRDCECYLLHIVRFMLKESGSRRRRYNRTRAQSDNRIHEQL